MIDRARVVLALALGITLPSTVRAQSAQPVSVQLSVLGTAIDNGPTNIGGIGVEPQVRFNWLKSATRGVISVGVGGQWTRHTSGPDAITITGVFLEPRWVFPVNSERFAPYGALRLGLLQQASSIDLGRVGTWEGNSWGSAVGGGGGFVVRITPKVNFDVGGAIVRQQFGELNLPQNLGTIYGNGFLTYAVKAGFTVGLGG
ncbi:MAG: hypothetical protein MUE41_06625 [Gemmatimonadaceae bacterium]|jgi:hypothetical protein|nr:hypothetical protein [Gemmatimonadaceae bacterium]